MSLPPSPASRFNRRDFIRSSASFAGLAMLSPPLAGETLPARRHRNLVTGRKLRIAHIGVGNKGYVDVMACAATGEEIVALCDVDATRGNRAGFHAFQVLLGAERYRDYRQMLTEMDDRIDAVVISTPDHTHFPAALMALERGKHVYVQKPLTHTIGEARLLKAAAAKAGVVTQMGNQGHAYEGARLIKEWIDAGVIGPVREVVTWTDRPIWPTGVDRAIAAPVPPTLDWNRWIGTGPYRDYSPAIAPWNWRAWWDYGSGGLGDMGCHLMDAAFWALNLRGPVKVSSESEGCTELSAPKWSIVTYQFPARGSLPPLKYTWYDGGKLPPKPEELGDLKMPKTATLYRGDSGTLLAEGDYNNSVRLIPESRMKAFVDRPPKIIPRVPRGDPYLEWITACKGGPTPGSNIVEHSADLTETVLLGNIALRLGKTIQWDPVALACVGMPEASRYIHAKYRLF
jgi:predicted dehydrogenase